MGKFGIFFFPSVNVTNFEILKINLQIFQEFLRFLIKKSWLTMKNADSSRPFCYKNLGT